MERKWVHFSSIGNDSEKEKQEQENKEEEEEEEEDEDALSLSDLPINEDNESRKETPHQAIKSSQEDFDFCSILTESSEMCSADEIFFEGQLLPLRNSSVSSERSLSGIKSAPRCFSRSESMGTYSYSSGFSSGSSRSSSIRSHQSSSSTTAIPDCQTGVRFDIKLSARDTRLHNNQFNSHQSSKPRIKYQSSMNKKVGNCSQMPTMWSHFRLGLLTTPEIALQDLKVRSSSKNNDNNNRSLSKKKRIKSDKRKKQSIFDKNGVLFGGCSCSVNAVETLPRKIVTIRRTASSDEASSHDDNDDDDRGDKRLLMKGTKKERHAGRQSLSRHRTFEWLKQLSLDSTTAADDALIQKHAHASH